MVFISSALYNNCLLILLTFTSILIIKNTKLFNNIFYELYTSIRVTHLVHIEIYKYFITDIGYR